MNRVSKLLLIGLLALFSFNALATAFQRDYQSQALSACQAHKASTLTRFPSSWVDPNNDCRHYAPFKRYYIIIFSSGGGYQISDYFDYFTSGSPPPTDAQCQARTHENITVEIDLTTDNFAEEYVNSGCQMYATLTWNSNGNICSLTDDPNIIRCEAIATGIISSTLPDSAGNSTDPHSDIQLDSGDASTTLSIAPTTSTIDTPNAGDVTTVQNSTTTQDFTSEKSISSSDPLINVVTSTKGGIVTTITTTTIINADGSSSEVIETAFSQAPSVWSKDTIDTNTNNISSSSGISSSGGSGTSTESTSKDATGTTTGTTTNQTGINSSGNTGSEQSELEGNCLDNEECVVTLNGEGLEDLATTQGNIDGVTQQIRNEEINLVSSISDDEGNQYGVDGVADFSSSAFISKYFTFPSPACSGGINTTIFGRAFVIEPCVKLQPLRDVLQWVFFILTAFAVIKIILRNRIV